MTSLPRPLGARAVGTAALLAVAACGGPPAGIPDQPGQIDAATLPDLITVGSPDLPFLLWLTPNQLAEEDWRACPEVFLRDDGITAVANDCVDSSGVRWYGTVSVKFDPANARQIIVMNDFGADDGTGGWTADGKVTVTTVASGNGVLVDTDVTMVSLANDESILFWADLASAYTTYGGVWYADRHDGWIGRQDWGTAEVTTRNVPLAFVYDCGWASHIAGSMAFQGENTAFVNFYTGPLGVSLPPPADTGAADTGDTGGFDTADTGGGDSADSGDTGDTNTDTGTDTSPPDFDDDDDPDGACGTCRDAVIGKTDLAECLDLTRSLSWPFPPPF